MTRIVFYHKAKESMIEVVADLPKDTRARDLIVVAVKEIPVWYDSSNTASSYQQTDDNLPHPLPSVADYPPGSPIS